MIRIFLSVIALTFAASARADVSDSGSLTIGGQGVIQGTMTVQGSAFSVGGATFSVAGGSVTLGGQLNVSAAGIKWADGTVSVSSSGGGVGNVVLTATQTFSGANTFTATTTFGGASGGLTINQGTACTGFSCRVDYSSGTLNTFSFVLQSTAVYHLGFSASITTGSTSAYSPFLCTINGDANATHYGQMLTSYANAYSINNPGSTANWSLCSGGTSNFAAQEGCATELDLKNLFGLSNTLLVNGSAAVVITAGAATTFNSQQFSAAYFGNAPWTITCSPVAGIGWAHEAILYRIGK